VGGLRPRYSCEYTEPRQRRLNQAAATRRRGGGVRTVGGGRPRL